MWAAHGSCFVPMVPALTDTPVSYNTGTPNKMDKTTAFWTFRYVHNLSYLRYVDMSQDIFEKQLELETAGNQLMSELKKGYGQGLLSDADVTKQLNDHYAKVLSEWWQLGDAIMYKYMDGWYNE